MVSVFLILPFNYASDKTSHKSIYLNKLVVILENLKVFYLFIYYFVYTISTIAVHKDITILSFISKNAQPPVLNRYIKSAFVIFALFIVLALLVSPKMSFNSNIIKADYSSFLYINITNFQALNKIMILLTQFGREVFWPIVILLLFVLGGWTGKKTAIIIAISMIIIIPLGVLAKDLVARIRPAIPQSDYLIASDSENAFPSGNAMIVSAGAATALALFRGTTKKLAVSFGLALEAALVCFSRVYVGGHYPLDVIGSIL